MKVLLVAINAKYIHSNLAIYNLKAESKEYEDSVGLAEYTINEYPEVILREISKYKADLVAVSCYIWNISYVEQIFSDFHKIYPSVPIWVGGPEVSYESELFLNKHPYIFGVMTGEGEETFYELLSYYIENRIELDKIKGIVYRDNNNKLVKNPQRELIQMDNIPFVYNNISNFKNKIIYYESSRGCPFSCSYCLSSLEKKVRFRSLDLVKKELLFFIKNNVMQVKFVDRTFNCDKLRAREIWKFILENDNGITNFHFEIAADLLEETDFAIFEKMRSGLIQLEIGVQSTNGNTLMEIRRVTDMYKIKMAANRINSLGNIHQHLDLIAGLPFEDFSSFINSFEDVFAMRPNQLQLGFLKVLKGSYIYENVQEYQIKYSNFPPFEVLSTKWIHYDEIMRLKDVEEMLEVYYNSRQFTYTLEEILKSFDKSFDFFAKLADYYERNGYNRRNHSRIARFNILREFVIEELPGKVNLISEYMLYDLYTRENLKSRPLWALDLSEYKDMIYEFYQKEEQNPKYLKSYKGYNFKQLHK